jgi:hypothetical protein
VNATETDSGLLLELKDEVVPVCEYVEAFISEHDFRLTRFGNRCDSPAEWSGWVHSLRSHERHIALMCDRHMREMKAAICPNPVCLAPRLTDEHPI